MSKRVRGYGLLAIALTAVSAACAAPAPEGEDAALEELEHAEGEEAPSVVTLSEAAFATAAIETLTAERVSVPRGGSDESVPGHIEFDPARTALISPRTAGRVERLTVVEGEAVEAGQDVAHILSTDFLTAQHDLAQASLRARALAGSAQAVEAADLVEAAERRLRLLGADDELIQGIVGGGDQEDFLAIAAPFAGRILTAHTLVGAAVEGGTPLFTLVDASVVDVSADVPERLLSRLSVGQRIEVTVAALPGRQWTGRVTRIKEEMDRATRTATALIRVANADNSLRAGMFATIRLGLPANPEATSEVVLPESAVVTDGEGRYVFIEMQDRTYLRQPVAVEPIPGGGGLVAVVDGLAGGETVVVRGAFTLSAELAKAGFGDEH